MNEIQYYIIDLIKDPMTVSEAVVNSLKSRLNFELPYDYLELMRSSREMEGEIGENSWLTLFPLENLIEINTVYLVMGDIPDYFLIGKDAADTGFAIHKFNKTYHSFGLLSDFDKDFIEFCGNNLTEFLAYLYNK